MSRRRTMGLGLVAATFVLAASARAQGPSAGCTYDACALNIVPRLAGLDVVRGGAEERIGTLGFLFPRPVGNAFAGSATAEVHADRAYRIRRIAAALTDVGGATALAGFVRAASTPHGRRTAVYFSLGGLALLGASVIPQFGADAELSRAVREYNRQFSR